MNQNQKKKRNRGQRWSFKRNTDILLLIHDHLIIMSSYNHKLYPGLSKWQNLNLDFLKTSICFCWQFLRLFKGSLFRLFCNNNFLWLHSNKHPSSLLLFITHSRSDNTAIYLPQTGNYYYFIIHMVLGNIFVTQNNQYKKTNK